MKRIAFALVLASGWLLFIAYVALAAVPLNPLSLNYEKKMNILSVVPEGWGFFTRDPREQAIYLYRKNETGFQLINYSLPDPRNLLGLSRQGRKLNIELFGLLKTIPDSSWEKGDTKAFSFACDSLIRVSGQFDHSDLRGEFLVIRQDRLPWSWIGKRNEIVMPYRKIRLSVY